MRYDFDLEDKREKRKKLFRTICIWVIEIAAVVGLAYFIVNYGLEKVTMTGDSMKNTLVDGDQILINKLSYRFTSPKRFDIIVYKQSGKEHSYYSVKRVIGLPGDTIQVKDGNVYINDEKIKEKVAVDEMVNGGLALEKIKLDEDEYFVLGDNRNDSEDSRFASIGNIVRDEIIGKAWIRTNSFTFVNQITNKE